MKFGDYLSPSSPFFGVPQVNFGVYLSPARQFFEGAKKFKSIWKNSIPFNWQSKFNVAVGTRLGRFSESVARQSCAWYKKNASWERAHAFCVLVAALPPNRCVCRPGNYSGVRIRDSIGFLPKEKEGAEFATVPLVVRHSASCSAGSAEQLAKCACSCRTCRNAATRMASSCWRIVSCDTKTESEREGPFL